MTVLRSARRAPRVEPGPVKKGGAKSRPRGRTRSALPAPLLAIRSEHKYVSRLLVMLQEEAGHLNDSGKGDYECMLKIMRYMSMFPDKYHHPKEDLIFDRMVKRRSGQSSDGVVEPVVASLREAHRSIAAENNRLFAVMSALESKPSRAGLRRLRERIRHYADSMHGHMQLEEAEIFAPALAQLSAADWAEIDEEIKPIIDPVFGDVKSDEFLPLFGRYVNRFVTVASGALPAGALESAATTVERMFYTAEQLRRLPLRLMRTGGQTLRSQVKSLSDVAHARDLESLNEALTGFYKACMQGSQLHMSEIWNAINATDPFDEADERPQGASPTVLADDGDFEELGERPYAPNASARVSWQAMLANLAFRVSVKPMMAHIGTESAKQMKGWAEGVNTVPPRTRVASLEDVGFRAKWVYAEGTPETRRTILYLPGGGFFFPALTGHTRMLSQLAREAHCQGLLVNYRLAPEHPFPAGLEDAISAYRHLLDCGLSSDEIVVAGDSAGGGLTLSLLLALRDEGLPLPAAGAIISALADLSFSTKSRLSNRWRDPLLSARRRTQDFNLYTGDTPLNDPLLSPIFGNFHGLPPLLAQVGGTEILLDDTLRVARKARAQGVDIEVEIWEGLPHDWHLFSFIPESKQALSRIAGFLRAHLDAGQGASVPGERAAAT